MPFINTDQRYIKTDVEMIYVKHILIYKIQKYYFTIENKILPALPAKSSRLLNHLSPETKERNDYNI